MDVLQYVDTHIIAWLILSEPAVDLPFIIVAVQKHPAFVRAEPQCHYQSWPAHLLLQRLPTVDRDGLPVPLSDPAVIVGASVLTFQFIHIRELELSCALKFDMDF